MVLSTFGGAIALSFAVFAILFFRYDRAGDENNEDEILALAAKAENDANPLLAVRYWRQLTALDPFNQDYARRYCRALLNACDFATLQDYTNRLDFAVEFSHDEQEFAQTISKGLEMVAAYSNDTALALFESTTGEHYYAATPYLIDCEIRAGRYADAIDAARAYIRRFPRNSIVLHTAEWCALADRPDLVEETRNAIPLESGYEWIVLDCYCIALEAWMKGDWKTLADSLGKIGRGVIDTPVFRLVTLESAAMGHDPSMVETAYRDLYVIPQVFDFHERGNAAVKHFIAEHFPDKLPLERLGRLADLVLRDGHDDIELLRIALLAQLESGTLTERNLSLAEHRFPGDKGLKTIREAYDKSRTQESAP